MKRGILLFSCMYFVTASMLCGARLIIDFPVTVDQVVNELTLGEAEPSGTGLVVFDTETSLLEWSISYEGLTGAVTAMHFHGPAAAGEATGVDLGIDEFGEDSSVGSATLTAEQAASLTDGLLVSEHPYG